MFLEDNIIFYKIFFNSKNIYKFLDGLMESIFFYISVFKNTLFYKDNNNNKVL
jgi:hypothetical protein